MEYGDLSKAEIKEALQGDEGPTILIAELENFSANTSEHTLGLYNAGAPNSLYLDIDFVNDMENSNDQLGDAFSF